MKYFYVFLVFFSNPNISRTQNEIDFIESYNMHIDPLGKLYSINALSMQIKSDINYSLNSTFRQIQRVRNCDFYSNGGMKCIDIIDNSRNKFDMPGTPSEYEGNSMKYQLNFIMINETDILSFKHQDDSIIVIEKKVIPSGRYIYTFNSRTKDLLQMQRIIQVEGEEYLSSTNFKSYQRIDGILVPKRINFSNHFSVANLEYSQVEFK